MVHILHRMIPLNIEEASISGTGAVFQDVHEHPVLAVVSHMIRNDIL
jgi:hypothetical protein